MIVRDLTTADEQLHKAIYGLLDAALDVPVYDRLPDRGKLLGDTMTPMPYVVISDMNDTDRSTLTTRGQRYEVLLIVYSDSGSRQEVYDIKRQVVEALTRKKPTIDGHWIIKARYLRGPVRTEPEPSQGRTLYRADIAFEYFTQVKPPSEA
jgi:hypothetical protein